jgi:hypothetical protein
VMIVGQRDERWMPAHVRMVTRRSPLRAVGPTDARRVRATG